MVEHYNGQSYFAYTNGVLTGIRCQDQGDEGVTIGWGSYVSWENVDIVEKYGITAYMSAKQLFEIIVPAGDCQVLFDDEVAEKETELNPWIEQYNLSFTKQQYDALI